jgi:hypothetical protein
MFKLIAMKVMCINEDGWIEQHRKTFFGLIPLPDKDTVGPSSGDIVTVTRQYWAYGKLYYDLLEWPPKSLDDGFCASEFVLTSEIDEMEMQRNYEKQKS